MRPILVFGRQGQVARELACLDAGRPMMFMGREAFDLAARSDIGALLEEIGAGAVINAAAYTAVDRAESEPEPCFWLNRDAPAAMARACAERAIPFTHISTDYVFDGEKSSPYEEGDATNPQSVYGASKAEGEAAVAAVVGT